MKCDVIKDLLPLYVDKCCSRASEKMVEEHLESCADCRRAFGSMRRSCAEQLPQKQEVRLHPISSWKASLLQSVMMFVSFAVMTLGVILEGSTPVGKTNGLWAAALIVPATGYLLSVANWFFVRVYKSRRMFSDGSCIATLAVTALGYVWAALHYEGGIALTSPLIWCGIALTAVFCALSKVLSDRYALLLGKE